MKKIFVVLLTVPLGGCFMATGSTQSLAPVCEALGPKIEYNPVNKNSDYHAGPKLATRLDQQYDVGVNLSCPGY